ncbi:hypothetical protein PPACK8108_LOCUS18893 [Phakopsora pachyrhizi]|uniref:AAA protein C-terminal winged helix domain-containing protein n=1 Tax=Phakopsora pachyrhizi TaxID=170000 RepID=A0AAV0BFI1_PHAPC|nr:hypothetical protein PPACK8108_LOCUS18893 [Phakopsora pachyrhizi]
MRSKMERWKGRKIFSVSFKCSPIDLQENKKKGLPLRETGFVLQKFSSKECCHLALQSPRWPGSQSEDSRQIMTRADFLSQLDHENMIAIDIDFKDPMGMVRWQILMISSSSSRCLIDPTPLPSTNPVRVESDSKGNLEVDHQAYWLGVPLNAVDKSLTRELKRDKRTEEHKVQDKEVEDYQKEKEAGQIVDLKIKNINNNKKKNSKNNKEKKKKKNNTSIKDQL